MEKKFSDMSKDELLDVLRSFYDKHGRCPMTKDLIAINGLPSRDLLRKKFGTGSLIKILKIAGLEPTSSMYTKNDALEKLKAYYAELGRIPNRNDFNANDHWRPKIDYYYSHFGGIKEAALLCGLIDKIYTTSELIDISIQEMRDLAKELGRCPTVDEYETNKIKRLSRRILENNLGMKYNDICRKYLHGYEFNCYEYNISVDELKSMIRDVEGEIGRLPMATELCKYGLPGFGVIKRVFGMTYNQLIESWGWKPIGSTTITKTKDEMLVDFNKLYNLLKRTPTVSELNDRKNGTMSHVSYIKHFGSIENVCNLLNVNCTLSTNGVGRVCRDANGTKCMSLPEMVITNFLIANDVKFEKGNSYSEIISGDNRQFDWKIFSNNGTYYVEYFGLFDCNPQTPMTERYFWRTGKKIKDLYDVGIADRCIFIFPWDYNNKNLSDIFAPYLGDRLKDIEILENYIYTDNEILDEIMSYVDNPNSDYLPSTTILIKNNSSIYKEIISRYGSYVIFAESVGKKVWAKGDGYWTKERMFDVLLELMNKYNAIPQKHDDTINKFDKKEMVSIEGVYGRINMKLVFFDQCVKRGIDLPDCEIAWIRKVANNRGSSIKGRVTNAQQESAMRMLDKMGHFPNT